jgi:hypothetical protein
MWRLLLQWAPVGVLALLGWGVDLVPGNESWIPTAIIWGIALLWLIVAFFYWFKSRKKPKIEQNKERQLKLDLGKLLLDGKEILVGLERMDARLDSARAVSAELGFEKWYKDVSKTLQKTDFNQLWHENKVGSDYYRKALKSDYIEACKYGLERLEYIKQLMFDKADSRK